MLSTKSQVNVKLLQGMRGRRGRRRTERRRPRYYLRRRGQGLVIIALKAGGRAIRRGIKYGLKKGAKGLRKIVKKGAKYAKKQLIRKLKNPKTYINLAKIGLREGIAYTKEQIEAARRREEEAEEAEEPPEEYEYE